MVTPFFFFFNIVASLKLRKYIHVYPLFVIDMMLVNNFSDS